VSADTDIAIVGVGARFPDAWTPEEFWANIDAGRVSMRPFTNGELRAAGVGDALLESPDYVRTGVRLPGVEEFAASFFDITPAEAEVTDPFQRVFLEVCWDALESAGHPPTDDGPLTGVFAGASFSTYAMLLYLDQFRHRGYSAIADGDIRRGSLFDFQPARVAHRLGLRGPAIGVQTACSSSLTAVHQAVNALLAGDCDIALAGGSGGTVPEAGYRRDDAGIASDDGLCRPFDATSSGTAPGSGVGVVVLRRLGDALDDGDRVLAVVTGSAVSNDGADRPGFTAPSPRGVSDVVSAALRSSGTRPDELCYVEAHGSGTPLGDHVELMGLAAVLTGSPGHTGLGSVKANVGHCGSAAGIAGLIKAVHIAHTGVLPPHPAFSRPRDPGVLAGCGLRIDTEPGHCDDPGRRVLVHSMGQGGTNVAVILAPPAPYPAGSRPDTGPARLVLSARTRADLDEISRRLADVIDVGELGIRDIAHTLRVGRRHFREHRRVVAVPDAAACAARPDRTAITAALRTPRPPAVRTVVPTCRFALIVRRADDEASVATEATLLDVLGPAARCAGDLPETVGDSLFVLLIGDGDPGPRGHAVTPGPDGIDAALTAAWLYGVDFPWPRVAPAGACRVTLPTYPLPRRRYWAIDRLGDVLRSTGAMPQPYRSGPADRPGPVEQEIAAIWAKLFGIEHVGLDDEFDLLGGTSLLATRMALEIDQRFDVHINLHVVGGTRATVRRISEVVRTHADGDTGYGPDLSGDTALVEADLGLPLGDVAPVRPGPGGVLLTGAAGFIGSFLLRELLDAGTEHAYCLVRAGSPDDAWRKLCDAADRYCLPAPDPRRVTAVPGDIIDPATWYDPDGRLAGGVEHVLHCAAAVTFSEPYRSVRGPNVVGTAQLLRWARGNGVPAFSYVSSLAAATPVGPQRRVLERREQPLAAGSGGYGTGKWASERLLDRAERDGLLVRVFRPGLVLGDSTTGACNTKDMTWRLIAGALATGRHPLDDRPMHAAPVDVVAAAIVDLMRDPAAAGRAYHLVYPEPVTLSGLFGELSALGMPTRGTTLEEWFTIVADRALATGDDVLSAVALIRFDDDTAGPIQLEAGLWRHWLIARGIEPRVTGAALSASVKYLAGQSAYRGLLDTDAGGRGG
jgi:phthiocerol/phenolphthiocerol synthesis type-I polyketide synthase E